MISSSEFSAQLILKRCTFRGRYLPGRRGSVMLLRLKLIAVLFFSFFPADAVRAAPQSRSHSSDFSVPAGLRPRVNFWINVFAKYGKNQVVFHHRNFPQAVFGTLDFSAEAETMGPVQLDVFRKQQVKNHTRRIQAALLELAQGHQPSDALERQVESAMRLVPGSHRKYREAANDQELIRSQTGIREKWAEAIKRASLYMHFIEEIFTRDYGLPVELTRLPFIESSFDYGAYSSVGAAGIWQLMPATARKYMTVSKLVDERRDVIASTRAAARYLQHAYTELGSWPLAITSYNHGVAGVKKRVREIGSSNIVYIVEHPTQRVFGFASANFYPEFLAALEVYEKRRQYFPEVREEDPLHLSEHRLSRAMSVSHVSRQLGVSQDSLRAVNFALSDAIWQGRYSIPAGYVLKVPSRQAGLLDILNTPEPQPVKESGPAVSGQGSGYYKVKAGDTLYSIARKFGTSAAALQELNGLKAARIRVGQVLKVAGARSDAQIRTSQTTKRSTAAAPSGKPSGKAAGSQKVGKAAHNKEYRVGEGESLWTISRKFKKTISELKSANKLKDDRLRPGQKLIVP